MEGCCIFGGSSLVFKNDFMASSAEVEIAFGSSVSAMTTETEAWFSDPMADKAG